MLLVQADGRIEAANRAFAKCVDEPETSLAGQRLDALARESAPELAEYLRECSMSGKMVPGRLTLRRGGQWIAHRCGGGAYRFASSEQAAHVLLRLETQLESTVGVAARRDKFEPPNARLGSRHEVEETLRQQREILDVTLGSIGDGVIVTDARGRITFLSAVAQTLTGWSAADAQSKQLAEVFRIESEDTGCLVDDPVLRVLQTGQPMVRGIHAVLLSREDRRVPVYVNATPIRLPSVELFGAVLIFRDISDKKRAEADQALLAAIIESSADAIASKTLQGCVTSWNQGAVRLFGYTPKEIVGKSITMIIPPELHDEERDILARVGRGAHIEHFDTIRVAKGGRRVEISLTVSPVRDASGKIVGASKVARDISGRKQIEAALREADRRKDEFLAMLAHELRNPLAPIRNATAVVCRAANLAPDLRSACEIIDRQVRQMSHLVDDLLDVSRITAGRVRLQEESLDLVDVLSLAIEACRPALDASTSEFETDFPPGPICVRGDRVRLAQVFSNVLGNSIKYTPRGGKIWMEVRVVGAEAIVSVRDSGIGIPPHMLKYVFDLFAQVDRAYDRTEGGLGVGLTVAKRLIEMHHGSVEAISAGINKGAEFVVRIPVGEAKAAVTPALASLASAPSARRKVLIADDNEDAAVSLGMLVEAMGHETRVAHDGLAALEIAESFRPDIVLLDIAMPRLDGYETARRLAKRSWCTSTLLIALTGWGQEADRRRARDAGFHRHIVKPVDPDVLAEILAPGHSSMAS